MIVFSLQKNKLWNGTGFSMKAGSLELSSMCFAEQQINIGSGKYKVKIIGSSISGNGILTFQLLLKTEEIMLRTLSLNSRANTEISFDVELYRPGPYTIKLSRGKESIGRVAVNLITLFKSIEKSPIVISHTLAESSKAEKIFFIIDYDNISSPSELSDLFVSLSDVGACLFLIKTNKDSVLSGSDIAFRLFFELSEIYDYLSLYSSKKVFYSNDNLSQEALIKFGIFGAIPIAPKLAPSTISMSGMLF